MISISMTTYDPIGHIELSTGKSKLGSVDGRVSRKATLDGEAEIIHSGVCQADRTFTIQTEITEEQKALLNYINENSILVNISCSEGFFTGAISSIDTSTQELSMQILIKTRETE